MNAASKASPLVNLARYHPALDWTATYKQCAGDFRVSERLGFDLTDEGEHLWVQIEKAHLTTQQLIQQLAKACDLPSRHIGYAGLKDKYGVTQQWLSLPLAQSRLGEGGIIDAINAASMTGLENGFGVFRLLQARRHQKKCRIGCHVGNDFLLTLRAVGVVDQASIHARLSIIADQGFPNYFTEQRFGRDQGNIVRFLEIPATRSSRKVPGILLSAGRSLLFNRLVSSAITDGTLSKTRVGDVMRLAGSMSYFFVKAEELASVRERRLARDIHKALPMIGADQWDEWSTHPALVDDCYQAVGCQVARFADKTQYRAAVTVPKNLSAKWLSNDSLQLQFGLPIGAYATALLRELGDLYDASQTALQRQ